MFHRGQMAVQGVVGGQADSFTVAITGGTGRFSNARGELKVEPMARGRGRLTFMVVD